MAMQATKYDSSKDVANEATRNIQSATGMVVEGHLMPMEKTPALKGAESAKAAGIGAEVLNARMDILSVSLALETVNGNASKAWIDGLLSKFPKYSQEALSKALKGDPKQKGTSDYVNLAYARKVYEGYLNFSTAVFHNLTVETRVSDDGTEVELPIGRDRILSNIRTALKAKAENEREQALIDEVTERAEKLGLSKEETEARIATVKAEEALIREREAEMRKSPSAQGIKAAKALIKAMTNEQGIVDWPSIQSFQEAFADHLFDAMNKEAEGATKH